MSLRSSLGLALLATALASGGCAFLRGAAADSGGGTYVDDSATSARVKTALLQDPKLKGTLLDVSTFRGNVTLAGVVENPAMEQRAAQIARATPGVRDVKDSMHVAQVTGAAEVETGTALR